MRPLYPIARTLEEALNAPLAFARSEIEAAKLDRAGAEVTFAVGLAPGRFKSRNDAEAQFETAIEARWGELTVDLNGDWRCWISYFRVRTSDPPTRSLSPAERTLIDQRLGAALGPKRARFQKELDFGLFETRDPDRPGWRMIDDE